MRTMTDEIRRYLDAVETELSDLDADDRAELLGDVEEHLREVAAEHEDVGLEERLGAPAAYASELRGVFTTGTTALPPSEAGQP